MSDNKKLIQDARALVDDWGQNEADAIAIARSLADALEAAEKALGEATVTPTDDEREALARLVNPDAFSKALWWKNEDHARHLESNARVRADEILAAGFRRSEVPEPSTQQDLMFVIQAAYTALYMESRTRAGEILADAIKAAETSAPLRDHLGWDMSLQFKPEPQGEPSDATLDAVFAAFRAHDRGEEFNELREHVCSECGYAYSWPSADGRQEAPARRRQRHIAREALRAAMQYGDLPLVPQDEPSDEHVFSVAGMYKLCRTCGLADFQHESQGEPSDAQVHAGWLAINGVITQDRMRAALRAALSLREGEVR